VSFDTDTEYTSQSPPPTRKLNKGEIPSILQDDFDIDNKSKEESEPEDGTISHHIVFSERKTVQCPGYIDEATQSTPCNIILYDGVILFTEWTLAQTSHQRMTRRFERTENKLFVF